MREIIEHCGMPHRYFVYIAASLSRCLYVGVTNDLRRRMAEHASGVPGSFTRRYRISRLVYFEQTNDARAAIAREKQLKKWPRWRKVRLIEAMNPAWVDLREDWRDGCEAPAGTRRAVPG